MRISVLNGHEQRYYLGGLNAPVNEYDPLTYLQHDLVPEIKGTPRKLAEIMTWEQGTLYASRGFHVSVTTGLQTKGDARFAWAQAAMLYHDAYYLSQDVDDMLGRLRFADLKATEARGASKTTSPPVVDTGGDTQTKTGAGASTGTDTGNGKKKSRWPLVIAAVALVGAGTVAYYAYAD